MHGRTYSGLAWMLAVALSYGAAGIAFGQQGPPVMPYDPAYNAVSDPNRAAPNYPAPNYPAPPANNFSVSPAGFKPAPDDPVGTDFGKRLAAVEKALKKAEEKADADKKKAASIMSVKPGGRIHLDTAAFSESPAARALYNAQNGVEFRRARLSLSGEGFDVISYQIEFDFANDGVSTKDVYMAIGELPVLGNVRIGHFKEPFSLEELTSANYITFMERSLPNGVIAPDRHIGIMAHDWSEDQSRTWAIGYFAEKDGGGIQQANHFGGAVTMRGTWLPWYDEATEGRGLLHTGIAYSYRDNFRDEKRFQLRPESHLAPRLIDVTLPMNSINQLGAELAFVYGPFSIQSEYLMSFLDPIGAPNTQFRGAYAQMSYFLTGEHRPYRRTTGTFYRVVPFENFFRVRAEDGMVYTGKGAWEVCYRYSYLDMFDGNRLGLALNSRLPQVGENTFGVNWYLTPYMRMMFDYAIANVSPNRGGPDGTINIFQARAQIDF